MKEETDWHENCLRIEKELLAVIERQNQEIEKLRNIVIPNPFKKIKGSKQIAQYCGFSQRTLFKKREQLHAVGAIGYENSGHRMQMHMVAYPYLLMKFFHKRLKQSYTNCPKGKKNVTTNHT